MVNSTLKVVVSRPHVMPAAAPTELRRRDFCWTMDGEILAPPALPCADRDTCGCAWSFSGITSARATSWGVIEKRTADEISAAIYEGKYLRGWAEVEDFDEYIAAGIHDLSERTRRLPVGTVVGIWTIDEERFGLFDRTLRRASLSGRTADRFH